MRFNSALTEEQKSKLESLLKSMTRDEKIGQLCQVMGNYGHVSDGLAQDICSGWVGSVINETDPNTLRELQRLAVEESR